MSVRSVLAGLGAAGRWLWARHAPVVLALFAAAGLAAADDYGLAWDEPTQRNLAAITADYVLEGDGALLGHYDRVFGPAFELPLLFAERLLGPEDSDVWRMRRLLTHAFFLAGGFFAWLLALRLTGSRAVALLALLAFLLHPRIWAHSFFNTKDVPVLVLFMVCLFLIHQAFRKDTAAAFLLAGVGVGLLTGTRLVGLLFFAAVPALRALDLVLAADGSERKRAAVTCAAFALAAAATLYAVWPWLWTDPLARFAEAFEFMSRRPAIRDGFDLFRGETFRMDDLPPDFVPWWFAITAPPFVLLLGLAGGASALYEAARRPLVALRNTDARFGLFLVACLGLPVLFVAFRGSTLYDDWRHVYFLWAPFCVLAALGLHRLAALAARRIGPGGPYAVHALAAVGVASTVAAMAAIHPHQYVYFNLLEDRTTPGWLRSQYPLDYWQVSVHNGLEQLLERQPGSVAVGPHWSRLFAILPPEDRRRVVVSEHPDYYLHLKEWRGPAFAPWRVAWESTAYGSAVVTAYEVDASLAPRWEEGYASAAAGRPALRSVYEVRIDGRALTYVRDGCGAEHEGDFFVHVYPADPGDLPRWSRPERFERIRFSFHDHGVRFAGQCVATFELPEYGAARVRTGQIGHRNAEVWAGEFPSDPEGWLARSGALAAREPLARGPFGVHLDGRTLHYVRGECAEADAEARFFLHVVPADADDLPEARRASGFDNLDFAFGDRGLRYEGRCMASVALPDYAIASVATGQFAQGGEVWRAEFALPP